MDSLFEFTVELNYSYHINSQNDEITFLLDQIEKGTAHSGHLSAYLIAAQLYIPQNENIKKFSAFLRKRIENWDFTYHVQVYHTLG
jgi:hypothetical protein